MSEKDLIKLMRDDAYGHREQMPSNFSQAIPDTAMMRKAVMMFKDSYLLDYINEEEIGVSRGPLWVNFFLEYVIDGDLNWDVFGINVSM